MPARPAIPETVYLISRRCSERRFFIKPSKLVFSIFVYLLAIASKRTGVLIHAVCIMGDHYHAVVTDPHGDIHLFYHYLHEFSAKCLNSKRGRFESMWENTETNRVSLEDTNALIEKVVYTLCNPVSSGLVSRSSYWDGLRVWWGDEPITSERPDYFRDKGSLPKQATLQLVPPPALADTEDHGVELISTQLEQREEELRATAREKGIKFVGRRRLAKQRWDESAASFAKRMGMRPRVATRSKWRRIEALQRNKQFEIDHADALREWRDGNRNVVFPYGTCKMRLLHRVRCAGPPS